MHADNSILLYILELLAAAVIAIPFFHRLGLGSVLGYLVAGAVLGPWGLKLITEVDDLRHVAEFGVVFLLFLIGLEMKPERLWVMRRLVFGLGVAQVLITALLLFAVAQFFGFPLKVSIIAAFGLALSSTAFGLQILSEKGALICTYGKASFAILLLQDLAVVPLMAMVSLLSGGETLTSSAGVGLLEVSVGIVCVILVGRFFTQPDFRSRCCQSKFRSIYCSNVINGARYRSCDGVATFIDGTRCFFNRAYARRITLSPSN